MVTEDEAELAVQCEYDECADDYDRRWKHYVDTTTDAVLEVAAFRGNETVLDLACGTGELLRKLLVKWPGLHVIGTDFSAGMLDRAKAKVCSDEVELVLANSADLPFQDCVFDCAVCANSFHYFADPQQSLSELRRVLRPGGHVIFVNWCDDYLACKALAQWLRWTDRAFYRLYTSGEMRRLLEQDGYRVADDKHFRIRWLWGMMRHVGVKHT